MNDFRRNRLRDASAIELLFASVSTEGVGVLVSHSILLTAERYCAPWDRSRRDRPTRTVQDAHQRDPLLAELYGDPAQEPGGSCNGSPVLPSGRKRSSGPCKGPLS